MYKKPRYPFKEVSLIQERLGPRLGALFRAFLEETRTGAEDPFKGVYGKREPRFPSKNLKPLVT